MKGKNFVKFFSIFLAFAMVLSLLAPFTASANVEETRPFKPENRNESIMQLKAAIAEQEQNQLQQPSLHPDLQGLNGNEEVGVIVHLSEDSVGLAHGKKQLNKQRFTATERTKVQKNVKAQQAQVKKAMQIKNIKVKEKFSYDTVLNGIALTVQADEIEKLLDIPGVTLVEPDPIMYIDPLPAKDERIEAAMATSGPHLGIEQLWERGIEGQSIKVGVLDTGIDYDHPEFEGIYKGGRNYILHNSQYARQREADDPYETSPKDRAATTPEFDSRGSSFYTSHGTHVAGTIAAIGNNEYSIKGFAPKVDLYAYRVLGAYGSGATSGIIKGIEDSVNDGMDVINLSLGGSSNSAIAADAIAINNAMIEGTVAVIATGNSGPNRGTIGNPSTAALGIAVGNSTNPEEQHVATVSVKAGAYENSSIIKLMGVKFGEDLSAALMGGFDLVAIPNVGAKADYAGIDANGKVALVSRGEIPFVDKIAAAKAAGAKAILIHNASNGTGAPGPADVYLGDSFDYIPAFDMSYTEGQALRDALAVSEGTISFSNVNSTTTEGDKMNPSSSRGPTNPNFDIKPDVTAPGTNIMSTVPGYAKDFPDADYGEAYNRKTGTSMATPHIAAIAALIRQANPSWTPFDVKVALSNTAKVIDTNEFDVFAQGPGRVQPYEAAFPTILAYSMDTTSFDGNQIEHEKGTITFGKLPQVKDQDVTVKKQIRIVDAANIGGDYSVRVETTKAFGNASVTVDKSSFTLIGTEMLEVTLTVPQTAASAGDEVLGYVYISGSGTEVSLPFAADFSGEAPTALENFAITKTDLSFNNDGVNDSAVLSFKLTGDVTTNYIELWDIMDPDGGEYGDGYIGYLHAGTALAAGSYTLNITGNYKPWTAGAPQTTIPDGLYTIDFTGLTVSGNPPVIGDYVGPVVVKSGAGTIEGAVEGTTATGKITDKYVDYQAELVNYGLGYDINTKLHASYEVIANNEVKSSGAIQLAQDGSFTFDVDTLNKNTDSVKVKYTDAAGNSAEQVLIGEEADSVGYAVNKENLTLQIGETEQLTVTETTTKPDGTTEERDVTAEAVFTSVDERVATVNNGNVTAVGVGETEITVFIGNITATVHVKVEATQQPDEQTYIVTEEEIANQVNSKAQEILVAVPAYENGISIEFSSTILNTIVKSKKNLVVKNGDSTFIFSKKAVEKLVQESGGDVTIMVSKSDAASIEESVSEIITLGLMGGTGDNRFSLNQFNEKINIVLQIDESRVIKSNKVAVLELNSNTKLKANYKKGTLEFAANGSGSFVVIND